MAEGIELRGAVVAVTGASSGIGRATAIDLARQGATVIAIARRTGALDDLVSETQHLDGQVEPAPADVCDGDALRAIADEAVTRHGRLDAWVNNAGVNVYGPTDEVPREDAHRLLTINLGGYVNGTYAALPHLRERGGGVIVNVSSVLGRVPSPYQTAYVASKHGIGGWSAAVRQEVRRDGIHVCEVLPGPVDTPLFRSAGNHAGREVVPPHPIVAPERIARAVLASLQRPRPTRIVGVQNAVAVTAGRLAPRLTERVATAVVRQQHFVDAPVASRTGNLYDADEARDDTTGGWHTGSRRAVALLGAGLLAVLASRLHTPR